MYVVYGLEDPRNNQVFYVGMTSDLSARFIQHIKGTENNQEKNRRINELQTLGVLPIPRTFETLYTAKEAREREAYWIVHYMHLGMPLTNVECTGRVEKQQPAPPSGQTGRRKKQLSAGQELEFIRLYMTQPNIRKCLQSMKLSYGDYQGYASQVVEKRNLRKG